MRPPCSSRRMPSRTVERFTANCVTSSASVPSGSPGRRRPDTMSRSMASATCRYAGVELMRENFGSSFGNSLGSACVILGLPLHCPTIRRAQQQRFEIGQATKEARAGEAARTEEEETLDPVASALLRVQDVGVRFGGIVALDGVSFDVLPGEIVGLIGPDRKSVV